MASKLILYVLNYPKAHWGTVRSGDIKYKDINGDGIIDSYDKVRGVGHPKVPEIVYGFGLNIEYKGFYASAFFQGAGNCSVLLGGNTLKDGFLSHGE